jgi:hypothetical protein
MLCLLAFTANAKNAGADSSKVSNKKFFTEWGYSALLGFSNSPTSTFTTYVSGSPYATYSTNFFTLDMCSLLFRFRYNIVELSKDQALSLSGLPAFGLGISFGTTVNSDEVAFCSFDLPLILDYNIGNVSTYNTEKENGFVIGAGVEYTKAPFFGGAIPGPWYDKNGNEFMVTPVTSWIEPVVELEYRYWNKNNKAVGFNLKMGFGNSGAFTARLSVVKCIGY